ncbi:unnamed protein product [Cylindrotheca closterium]|uniref:Uncharacterized protein n=1 Tax=Cylindrotheca closterium TaxID=2856 RepID=A0AAD2CIM7_9STRA|nr:unnamed protein product [Cylindrotheca closterium]
MKQPCIDSTFYILLIGVAATQNTLAWTTLPSTSKNLPHRCAQSQRWSYNKNPDDNNEMDEADLNIFSMGDLFRDGSFDPDGSFDADDFQDIASSLSSSSSSSSSNNLDDNNNNNEMDEANLNLFSMDDLFTDFNDDAADATTATTATSSTTTSFDEETMSSLSSSLSSSTNTNPYINNDNNNNNKNDDIVDIVDNPGSLQRLARGSDNTVWANSINLRKERSSYGQLDAETLAKMQEIAEQEEAMKEKTNNDGNNNNSNNNNYNNKNDYESSASASALQQQDEVRNAELEEIMGEDYQDLSFFLSEDDYMRASRSIKADGSLPEYIFEESTIDDIFGNTSKETKKQQQQQPAAARPNNMANSRANGALSSNAKFDNDDDDDDDDDETSMRELMNMLKQKESIPETDDKLQAKEIRDRVFSQEETFASQHVDSDEYKLYEEAITTGLLNKDQGGGGGGGGDEVDQALEGLQEMINQKYSTGRDAQPQQLSAKSEDDYISSTSTTKE